MDSPRVGGGEIDVAKSTNNIDNTSHSSDTKRLVGCVSMIDSVKHLSRDLIGDFTWGRIRPGGEN